MSGPSHPHAPPFGGDDDRSVERLAVQKASAQALCEAMPHNLLKATDEAGDEIEVESSLEAMPSVLWDAVVVPGGDAALSGLCASAQVIDFLKEQYRHCKPMRMLGGGATLLQAAGVPVQLASRVADPGLVVADTESGTRLPAFLTAVARHRHCEREQLAR